MNGLALLLPGQGSQVVGMGRELAEAHDPVRRLYEQADALLGFELSRLCWEGPEVDLRRTENAQPAILLHSYALWVVLPAHLRDASIIAAGHSLGEFTAYLIAGSLSFADALCVVRRRGELMAASEAQRPGTMAAVIGLDEETVYAVCAQVEEGAVVPANFNAPGQIVISGDTSAVSRASALALESGAKKVHPLNVSGAFHSPLMEGARAGLREVLESVDLANPAFPVVANASATPVTEAATARRLLIEQLSSPVRWVESIGVMRRRKPDRWLEVGPGRVLSGLLRRIDPHLRAESAQDLLVPGSSDAGPRP